MSCEAQATADTSKNMHMSKSWQRVDIAGLIAATVFLAGCGGGGLSMSKVETDHSITTSTPSLAITDNTTMLSDQSIIRNAVSAADIETVGNAGLSWANTDTGSRGAISSITEYAEAGSTCRKFVVSRESFDGVSLYDGDACLVGGGAWKLRAFKGM